MGLEGSNASDLIEQAAAAPCDPDTATARMLSMIHKKVAEHRDALGFPKGDIDFPHFYVTNDLCAKFGQAMKLLTESDVGLSSAWVVRLAREFVASYDDQQAGFYHSAPKDTALKVLEKFEALVADKA